MGLVATAALATLPVVAAAQPVGTIRGIISSCSDRHGIAGATVELRNLDEGLTTVLRTDAAGRFVRVGTPAGRYLIWTGGTTTQGVPLERASRLARLQSDDVLDVALGSRLRPAVVLHTSSSADARRRAEEDADVSPHPLCDPAIVPPAPQTADRYILR